MAEKYSHEELEKFVDGMVKASNIICQKKPDFIFAPLTGAVPFIDILKIIDRHFPIQSVEYPPNSSRFADRKEIINRWYGNFLDANYAGEELRILCIDEVISGSSASFGYAQFMSAAQDLFLRKAKNVESNKAVIEHLRKTIAKNLEYHILGIAEDHSRNHNFKRITHKNKNHVNIINLPRILTLDDVALNPIRLKVKEQKGKNMIYLPEVERYDISTDYLKLLQDVARYVGVDPSSVSSENFGRIQQSLTKYLSSH